jgi:hypothetical protein
MKPALSITLATVLVVGAVSPAPAAGQAATAWLFLGPDPAAGRAICLATTPSPGVAVGGDRNQLALMFNLPQGNGAATGEQRGTLQVDTNALVPLTWYVGDGRDTAMTTNPPNALWGQLEGGRSVTIRFGAIERRYDLAGYHDGMAKVLACIQSQPQATVEAASSPPPAIPAAAALPERAIGEGSDLLLTCHGDTSYTVTDTGNFNTGLGGPTGSAVASTTHRISRPAVLEVEIHGAEGRVRPPMVPLLRGLGAGDGWWRLKDLRLEPDRISGRWSFNLLNNPELVIDRRDGTVSVSGSGLSFRGRCEPAVDAPRTRRFQGRRGGEA